jgi:hypothetical protein
MFTEGIFQIALILATILPSLVAGLLFGFAIVVMPGRSSFGRGTAATGQRKAGPSPG